MQRKIDLLDERSEMVKETLGKVPSRGIRYGISILALVVLIFIFLSWLIKYPDIIEAKATIVTIPPPIRVVAQADGEILDLLVKDHSFVQQFQPLAIIKNTARMTDIDALNNIIDSVKRSRCSVNEIIKVNFPDTLELGGIQSDYFSFLTSLQTCKRYYELNLIKREIEERKKELHEYHTLEEKQQEHSAIFKKELTIVKKDYERNKKLFDNKVISEVDFEEKEKTLYKLEREYQELNSAISNIRLAIIEARKTMMQLELKDHETRTVLEMSLNDNYQKLLNSLNAWEHTYVLKAPIAGYISFFDIRNQFQFVKKNDEVMTVYPEVRQTLSARIMMPAYNSGKVLVGQQVIIRLDDYPFQEFGSISGKVASISQAGKNNSYMLEVNLPQELVTSYNKKLTYRPGMEGKAEIITEDLRLLDRMFYQLKSLFTYNLNK